MQQKGFWVPFLIFVRVIFGVACSGMSRCAPRYVLRTPVEENLCFGLFKNFRFHCFFACVAFQITYIHSVWFFLSYLKSTLFSKFRFCLQKAVLGGSSFGPWTYSPWWFVRFESKTKICVLFVRGAQNPPCAQCVFCPLHACEYMW